MLLFAVDVDYPLKTNALNHPCNYVPCNKNDKKKVNWKISQKNYGKNEKIPKSNTQWVCTFTNSISTFDWFLFWVYREIIVWYQPITVHLWLAVVEQIERLARGDSRTWRNYTFTVETKWIATVMSLECVCVSRYVCEKFESFEQSCCAILIASHSKRSTIPAAGNCKLFASNYT